MRNNHLIDVQHLSWKYNFGGVVLEDISFNVQLGEIIGIIGPNGCGKTTLLHLIAKLLRHEVNGTLTGKCDLNFPSRKSSIGFVFQNYSKSLFPWRTVFGNVRAGLEMLVAAGESSDSFVDDDALEYRMKQLELNQIKNSYPYEISGGQAQLTAIARALVTDSSVLILDEPTSSLHYSFRNKVLDILLNERKKRDKTILFSSHSLEEASFLADRILVLKSNPTTLNKIEQSNMSNDRDTRDLGSLEHLDMYKKLLQITKNDAISY